MTPATHKGIVSSSNDDPLDGALAGPFRRRPVAPLPSPSPFPPAEPARGLFARDVSRVNLFAVTGMALVPAAPPAGAAAGQRQ